MPLMTLLYFLGASSGSVVAVVWRVGSVLYRRSARFAVILGRKIVILARQLEADWLLESVRRRGVMISGETPVLYANRELRSSHAGNVEQLGAPTLPFITLQRSHHCLFTPIGGTNNG